MIYRLRVTSATPGSVRLTVGWFWRTFFIVLAGASAAGIVFSGRIVGLFPVIALMCLTAALYDESWRFDAASDTVVARAGIIPFRRSQRYRLSDLRRVQVRTHAPFTRSGAGDRTGRSSGTSVPLPALQRGYVEVILEFVREHREKPGAEPGADPSNTPAPDQYIAPTADTSTEDEAEAMEIQRPVLLTESLRGRRFAGRLAREIASALDVPVTESR